MSTLDRISIRNDMFQKPPLSEITNRSKFTISLRKSKRSSLVSNKRETFLNISFAKDFPPDLKTPAPFLFDLDLSLTNKLTLLDELITPNNSELFPSITQVVLILQNSSVANLGNTLKNFVNLAIEELSNPNCPLRSHYMKCFGRMVYESNLEFITEKHLIRLVGLLSKRNSAEFFESLVISIGNIAADSIKNRDQILLLEGYKPIFKAIDSNKIELKCLSNIVWALCSLLKGFPLPLFTYVGGFLARVNTLLNYNNDEIIYELLWGISNILEASQLHELVFKTISFNFICSLVRIQALKIPALRCLGITIYRNSAFSADLISSGVLEILLSDLNSLEINEIQDILILVSNLSESGADYAHLILEHELFCNICSLCSSINEVTKQDSLSAIECLIRNSDYPEVICVFNKHSSLFASVVQGLSSKIPETLLIVLKLLKRLFEAEEEAELLTMSKREFFFEFNQTGGLDALEGLQIHQNDEVYKESKSLIQRFWEYDIIAN